MTITTLNPATGETLQTYETWDAARIDVAVARAHAAAREWAHERVDRRVEGLKRLAEALRAQKASLAELISREMGKPLSEALGEVEKSAVTAIHYAEHVRAMLADEKVAIDGVDAWVSYEPIGLVLAVMPWNFPVWQVMRFAIPAVACGNGILLKHSPNVTGCALALERLFIDAHLPPHLLTVLVVDEDVVAHTVEYLIADDRIAAVTLTGSNRAGAAVGAAAGRAAKKSVLELGGSDAFVVLDDADVPAAAAAAVKARFHNAGQSCVCAKRFIVAKSISEQFTALFAQGARALKVGDAFTPGVQVGPLARADLRFALQRQIDQSIGAGGQLVVGGRVLDREGCFFEPTVIANTGPGMAVFDEETFGPVAAIAVASDDEDAAGLADASAYGLSISIWSASRERAVAVARKVTTGAAFVNAATASDVRLPFGGTKRSGYGRELALAGVREFCNVRTYWVV